MREGTNLRELLTREFLLCCAPALLLGLALRIALTTQLPYAYFHDDTPDFLLTPDRLIHQYSFQIHDKKTFLVPLLFTLPFLIGTPALIVVPIFQHLLGLGLVVLIGLLCRLWFQRWRVFIVPLTVLVAVNPFYLWYEHTLMAETTFVFATTLLALAGTLYALDQSRARFAFLLLALFLEAGARPEGKLFFLFAILLVTILHARRWRKDWWRLAAVVALASIMHFLTGSGQSGVLLYTSVARWTPGDLKCAPGFDPYIAPLRAHLQQLWEESYVYPRVRHRKEIEDTVERYLRETRGAEGNLDRKRDALCMQMATEVCRRNLFSLPLYVGQKFRLMASGATGGVLDNQLFFEKQREAFVEARNRVQRLSRGLTGQALRNQREVERFVDSHYGEVPWFNRWQEGWLKAVNFFRGKDLPLPDPEAPGALRTVPGLPLYFVLAALGLLALCGQRGGLQPFHLAWGVGLIGFFFVVVLTANVRPRFRFVFEPFWFLYLALLAEMIWLALSKRKRAPA